MLPDKRSNWHRVAYALLLGFQAVCLAIVSHTVSVPPEAAGVAAYAALASVFLYPVIIEVKHAEGDQT